jgi:formylglycine-generating enzyme required for sulfatase activity
MLKPIKIQLNDLSFLMIPIEGGTFDMGDEVGDLWEACSPVHTVQVSSFYLAQYPLTQALWESVMEKKWPHLAFKGGKRPMERVSWDDAREFLERLKTKTGYTFRLPSEAEWEYAARGGRFALGCRYAGSDRLKEVAWYDDNSHNQTKPIGRKMPNELGLYDMSGNVWEWCADDWHSNYEDAPLDRAAWINAKRGSYRVCRGGSWVNFARSCRSAYRDYWLPGRRLNSLGFRLALSLQSVGQPPASL